MIVRKFEWKENQFTGFEGWALEGGPEIFDPGQGLQVAHDCYEHFDYDGSLESELMAFGAILYIRGGQANNYWAAHASRDCNPASQLAPDLVRFLAEREFQVKLRNTHRDTPLADEDDESVVAQLPYEMRRYLRDEVESQGLEVTFREVRQALRMTQHWIRHGYRRASRRWKFNRADVCDCFVEVERQVDKACRGAVEGDRLIVRLDTTAACFEVEKLTEEDLNDY